MARKPPPDPPAGLTPEQAELWTACARLYKYSFEARDLIELRNIVDVARRLSNAREQIEKDGLMIAGSMGQSRVHPLLSHEAKLRVELLNAVTDWNREHHSGW